MPKQVTLLVKTITYHYSLQSSLQVDYGKLKERLTYYSGYHFWYVAFLVAGIGVPLGLLMYGGGDDDPNYFEYRIAALIALVTLLSICRYFYNLRQKYLISFANRSFLNAFEAFTALKSFAEKELEANKIEAKDAVKELISGLDSRWSISEKSANKSLEDFDYLMNPTAKLMMILQNAYLPIIERGIKSEMVSLASFKRWGKRRFLIWPRPADLLE